MFLMCFYVFYIMLLCFLCVTCLAKEIILEPDVGFVYSSYDLFRC